MWQLTDHKAEKTDVPKTKTLKKYNFIKKQQQQNVQLKTNNLIKTDMA
jgi:hypothetical protein